MTRATKGIILAVLCLIELGVVIYVFFVLAHLPALPAPPKTQTMICPQTADGKLRCDLKHPLSWSEKERNFLCKVTQLPNGQYQTTCTKL